VGRYQKNDTPITSNMMDTGYAKPGFTSFPPNLPPNSTCVYPHAGCCYLFIIFIAVNKNIIYSF
jgi:hypothetical protein